MHPTNELNDRLMKYRNECGCAAGAKSMLLSLAACIFITVRQYGLISIGFLTHIPLILLIPFLCAGLGKGAGILYARIRYKQLSKQIEFSLLN